MCVFINDQFILSSILPLSYFLVLEEADRKNLYPISFLSELFLDMNILCLEQLEVEMFRLLWQK